ncbi:hypothetical protein [Cupriavidus necator]
MLPLVVLDSADPDPALPASVHRDTTPGLPAHPAGLATTFLSFSDANPISPEHGSNAS